MQIVKRFLFLCFLLPAVGRAQSSITQNAPIKNFKLWVFNKDGDRSGLVRGSEALSLSTSDLSVKELNFTSFIGGDTNHIDTILLASSASVSQVNNEIKANGDDTVRVIRPGEVEVSGRQWIYDNSQKKIIIKKDAHVIVQGQLKDLIK